MAPTSVHIGVLLLPPVQLLDVSPIDIFGMLTPLYLAATPFPSSLKNGAVPIDITYISPLGSGALADCTASAKIGVDAGINSPEVAPGKLDILMIPGPDPGAETGDEAKEFIRGHAEREKVTLMVICTGCVPAGRAGVLKGKKATGPRALLAGWRKEFPDTEWVDKRWVRDGRVWTSGGITNGQDMVATYIRETWPGPTTEAVLAMADVGGRDVDYNSGQAADNLWWLWQTLRGWVAGKNE